MEPMLNIRYCELNMCWFAKDKYNRTWINWSKRYPKSLKQWKLYKGKKSLYN